MFVKLTRTFRAGVQNFIRNGWLSIATVSVIVTAMFIINVQVAVVTANELLLKDVQERVNISVYFKTQTEENRVLEAKREFEVISNVTKVVYISKEQALENFKASTNDNETIRKSIEELGTNPLESVLNVSATDPDEYEAIAGQIDRSSFAEDISKVNYQKYRGIINSLNKEIKSNQRVAILLGLTLSIVAILITFNSIRINMYSHRQEIEIMRLVGASNNYVRLPFIFEGIFYGFAAAGIAVPLAFFYLNFISSGETSNSILPFSNTKFIQTFLNDYFIKNIILIVLAQFFLGIFLGVVSSAIAIRKYLKIR
ncbi:MAG: permease-like cell division protein FtsX [Patescibacteria group bacterium]|nr:permease-like cell division protein FtsX [Patescibacteria group bacterium]